MVKEVLYCHFRVTQATYRSRLDQLRRQPGETWSTAGERGKCLTRRWLAKCKTVDKVADLIAEDAIVKSMPRQLLVHVRDRKTDTMKESVSVADDFMSVRRWSYDVVHEPDRTAVKTHRKEEKLCSSAETGKDRPASPRTNRRNRSSGHLHSDQPRDYWKDNNLNCAGAESDQKNNSWKQQPKFDRQCKPRCYQCNAYRHFAAECHSKPAVTKTKAEGYWVGALTQQQELQLVESNVDKRATVCGSIGGQPCKNKLLNSGATQTVVHTESELDFGPSIVEGKESRLKVSDRLTNEENI